MWYRPPVGDPIRAVSAARSAIERSARVSKMAARTSSQRRTCAAAPVQRSEARPFWAPRSRQAARVKRSFKRLDDAVQSDLVGGQRQLMSALSSSGRGDESGSAQPAEHLTGERGWDPLTISDLRRGNRGAVVVLGQIDQGTNPVVAGRGQLHHLEIIPAVSTQGRCG